MSLYKVKLEGHPCGKKITKKHSKWRRWAKNQRNRFIRRKKMDNMSHKFFKDWEY